MSENLRPIVSMVEGGMLPSLEVISYVVVGVVAGLYHCEQDKYKLAKSDVRLFIAESRSEHDLVLTEP